MIEKSLLTQQNINQLIREIKIQSFLNHPNIINLYQYFIDSTFVYLLLQPCLGGNLFKHMSKQITNSLPEKDVKKYIKEILGTVDYLHKNDIIHRDIKPENILLHENTVKICDFGWAVYSPLLRSTQCGTPLYASPQMVKSQYYDNKIDIWCIGVLTFELLYGQAPFKINQISDIAKIVDEEIYFPIDSQISTNAIQFMKGCLEKKAVRRFEVRQAIEHDFIRLTRANEKFRSTII